MFWTVFWEILVCMLAVYGVYAIVCRLFSHGAYRGDLAIGVRVQPGRPDSTPAAVTDAVRRAQLLTEGQCGRMLPPVILLKEPDHPAWEELSEYCRGYEVYILSK